MRETGVEQMRNGEAIALLDGGSELEIWRVRENRGGSDNSEAVSMSTEVRVFAARLFAAQRFCESALEPETARGPRKSEGLSSIRLENRPD